jgi:hypothetical protein
VVASLGVCTVRGRWGGYRSVGHHRSHYLSPTPILLKYWGRSGLMAHSTSSPASILLPELSPSMSSPEGLDAGGEGVPEKRGPGRPKGSVKTAAMPATTMLASGKRGRPKGSRNQKTLAALAVVAAAAPNAAAAARVAPSLGDEGALRKRGPVARRGVGRRQRRRRWLLLHRLAAANGHRAARIRKLLLPSGSLPLAPRGPAWWPLLRQVRLSLGRRCRRSSSRPTPRPKGGPPL